MSSFVFIYPWMLLLLLPAGWFIWWMYNHQNDIRKWSRVIDKRFLSYLLMRSEGAQSRFPAFSLIAAVMLLLILVIAGPSFTHRKSPFRNDSAKVAFVIKNTPSMLATDLEPSRLKRAVIKLTDLLKLRPKLRASLIVYSGSANEALPVTHDGSIVISFADAMDPSVMPAVGDALAKAVSKAADTLKGPGSIVVFADSVAKTQVEKIQKAGLLKGSRIIFVAMIPKDTVDRSGFNDAKRKLDADVVYFSKEDDSDVNSISSDISHNFKNIEAKSGERNNDGYCLLFIVAFLMLFWFRKGYLAEAWRVS